MDPHKEGCLYKKSSPSKGSAEMIMQNPAVLTQENDTTKFLEKFTKRKKKFCIIQEKFLFYIGWRDGVEKKKKKLSIFF
jgi:hypothetical protein